MATALSSPLSDTNGCVILSLFIFAELGANPCCDITRDVALHLKHVRNRALVHAFPQVLLDSCVNQLHGNPQPVA